MLPLYLNSCFLLQSIPPSTNSKLLLVPLDSTMDFPLALVREDLHGQCLQRGVKFDHKHVRALFSTECKTTKCNPMFLKAEHAKKKEAKRLKIP